MKSIPTNIRTLRRSAFCTLLALAAVGSAAAPLDDTAAALQRSMIWLASPPADQQVYAVFRRRFDVAAAPRTATLHLFADSRYILWVNGQYVQRGPCRFDPIGPEYDTLDLQSFLRPGANQLAVLVHHYGKAINGRTMQHAPGLTAQLQLVDSQDRLQVLRTDSTWSVSTRTRFGPSPDAWSSIPDRIDARRDTGDWTQPGFDDSAWDHAAGVDGRQWGPLRPRTLPLLRETESGPLTLIDHNQLTNQAKWIWTAEPNFPRQKAPRWSAPEGERFFRRTFDLPDGLSELVVLTTADNEFDGYLNGRKIGENHGGIDSWTRMRRMDATQAAVPGRNVLAIRALNKDYNGASDPAGLLVEVRWKAGQNNGILMSDNSWKSNFKLLDHWDEPGFDDANWPPALALGAYGIEPWGLQVNDYSTEPSAAESGPPVLNEVLPIRLETGQQLVVDAGAMMQAYSVLDFEASEGSELQVQYAERFRDSGGRPADVHAQVNEYIARNGRQTYLSGDTYGFKYLVLRLKSGQIRLHGVRVVQRGYPFDRLGRFTSNDPLLDRIWQVGVKGVEVCSEDAYVDCAARERTEWMADGYAVAYRVTQVALAGPGAPGQPRYGDPRLLASLLRHIGQSVQPDGRLKAHHPSDRWDIHGYIEDYSCLWVQAIREYYRRTGDAELARELWPPLTAQMQWFLDRRTEHGLVKAREFVYFGNPLCYQTCEGATLNACVFGALRDAAFLAQVMGKEVQRAQYSQAAEALYRAVNLHLWDPAAGAYCGSITNQQTTAPTAHAATLCLYNGIVPKDRRPAVVRWLLANYRKEGFFPYTHQFLLGEIFQAGSDPTDREAIDLIRERWAAMAKGETGTCYESFTGGEYCHESGAAATYYLSAFVLGARLAGPVADRRLIIEPHLGDLKSVAGVCVTELGLVPLAWKRGEGRTALEFHFTVPEGAKATASIPKMADRSTLEMDGKTWVSEGVPTVSGVTARGRYFTLELGAGVHTGRVLQPQR